MLPAMVLLPAVLLFAGRATSVNLQLRPGHPSVPPVDAVFTPGEEGYACYRAPSLTYATETRLLAIVEAYKLACVSRQWCDIVQKVSTDSGRSWSRLALVHGTGSTQGNASSPCFNNVSPTLDRRTGTLFLPIHAAYYQPGTSPTNLISAGAKTMLVRSTDAGRSFSSGRDVSTEFAQGVPSMPGGVQLSSGRLVVPTYRNGACPSQLQLQQPMPHTPKDLRHFCAYLVLSDDGGEHWRTGAEAVNGSECQVTTLLNGSVVLNMRDSSPGVVVTANGLDRGTFGVQARGRGLRARRMAISHDSGESFARHWVAWDLPDPCVEGSTVRIPGTDRLLFSHPSPGTAAMAQEGIRANLSVWSSTGLNTLDSWKLLKVIQPGPSAYSSLAIMPNKSAALVLYEGGELTPNGDPCQGKHPCWQSLARVPLN